MRRIISLWVCIFCIVLHVPAQNKTSFSYERFVQGSDTLLYRLLLPVNYDPAHTYPLLVFLHGAGVRGNDNETQVNRMPRVFVNDTFRNVYPCIFVVPQCPLKDTWVNFAGFPQSLHATDTPTTSARLVLELVKQLSARKSVDKKRIYLTGLSMGGEGTLDLMARNPKLFAAGVAICPVADTAHAEILKHKPIWLFHGDNDAINNVVYSRIMVEALKKKGSSVRYTEYAGEGHSIWNKAYAEPELFKWLFNQRSK